ncbi:MAG: winged helix DNA-binding protein, partial [Candidatus Omnitrophica bacterium]|nr:winged helix DNA-binding protein [Candidatus Omnitrophota bacterium]
AGRLSRAGYVRRLPCATDRRQVLVQLTPKGEQFIRDFQSVIRRRWEDVLRLLSARELASFHQVVTKLTASLQSTL